MDTSSRASNPGAMSTGQTTFDGRSVLVVDDEDVFRNRLVLALRDRGFDAKGVPTALEAIASAELETPECALVDLRMPHLSGLHVVRKLHELDATTRIVVLTGYGSIATALDAVRSGAVHYLTKPADIDEIVSAFDHTGVPADFPPVPTVPSLERVEWEHIDRILVSCEGNITRAAELLGLDRRSLQRKLNKRPVAR